MLTQAGTKQTRVERVVYGLTVDRAVLFWEEVMQQMIPDWLAWILGVYFGLTLLLTIAAIIGIVWRIWHDD